VAVVDGDIAVAYNNFNKRMLEQFLSKIIINNKK
jgi:hypothetical protein